MKLVRFGAPGREKPGMLDAKGQIRDLSKHVPDIAGDVLSPKGLAKLRKLKAEALPLVRGTPRLGACVGKFGNFIAIGLNYSDHAAEAGSGARDTDTLHRIDQKLVEQEVTSAGFVLVESSDLLHNPDDPHTAKVFEMPGKSDKFLLKFQKPAHGRHHAHS